MLFLFLLATTPVTTSLNNGLARTPPRGWRSWNWFLLDINQEKILAQAKALAKSYPDLGPSLLHLNYTHIGIDDGWQDCGAGVNGTFHNRSGFPIWDLTKFPNPQEMVRDAKAKYQVDLGWYGNNCHCDERQGHEWPWQDGGHTYKDAIITKEYGFKGMKIDGCGPNLNMTEWTANFLRAGNNDVIIEDCLDKSFIWRDKTPPMGVHHMLSECPMHFYRTTSDIAPSFYSSMYNINAMTLFLSPYYGNPTLAPRPGCWSYPDMLEVGVGLTVVESKTHFAAWCVLSAPLILGFDLTNETVYRQVYPIISNVGALSVSSQWAGNSGRLVQNSTEYFWHANQRGATNHSTGMERYAAWQIWAKPMEESGKRWAVLLINVAETARDIPLTFAKVSVTLGEHPNAVDVWSGEKVDMKVEDGVATFEKVASHDSLFLFLAK